MAASTWLLTWGAAWGIVRPHPHHVDYQPVDTARWLGPGAEDALARVAVLGLGLGEFGLNRSTLLAHLGQLAIVTLLQPPQSINSPWE